MPIGKVPAHSSGQMRAMVTWIVDDRLLFGGGMSKDSLDPAAIVNRALERAQQNLTIDKLLHQIGVDPANVTVHTIFDGSSTSR